MASSTRRIKRNITTGLWTRTDRRVEEGRLSKEKGMHLIASKTTRRKSRGGVVEVFPPRGRDYPAMIDPVWEARR